MKNRTFQMSLCAIFFLGLASVGNAENLSDKTFRIGKVEIGKTTFDEIKKIYGKAEPFRISKDDGAEEYICYVKQHGKLKQYIVFETGEMGGYKQVTGFRLTANKPQNLCILVSNEILEKTDNGISIGEQYEKFVKKFPVSFKGHKKSSLTYENVSQREATADELEYLRKTWPNERETRFDVTVTVNAQFKNRRLIDYRVGKIESY